MTSWQICLTPILFLPNRSDYALHTHTSLIHAYCLQNIVLQINAAIHLCVYPTHYRSETGNPLEYRAVLQ